MGDFGTLHQRMPVCRKHWAGSGRSLHLCRNSSAEGLFAPCRLQVTPGASCCGSRWGGGPVQGSQLPPKAMLREIMGGPRLGGRSSLAADPSLQGLLAECSGGRVLMLPDRPLCAQQHWIICLLLPVIATATLQRVSDRLLTDQNACAKKRST